MLFAVLTAGAMAFVAWWLVGFFDRRSDLRRHASVRAAMGEPDAVPDHASKRVGTLEGRIAAGGPLVVSFHPAGTSFLDEPNVYATTALSADHPLVLHLGEGRTAVLEGAVQVLSGSVETEHGASLDDASNVDATALRDRRDFRTRVGQFRRVAPGDTVRVRGEVWPAPDDAALYRAPSSVVSVRPAPSDLPSVPRAVTIASTEPPRRLRTRPSLVRWGISAAVLAGSFGAVYTTHLRQRAPTLTASPSPVSTSETRARAAWTRALGNWSDGDFARASDDFAEAVATDPRLPPSLTETESHLFAHQYARAAAAAHRMVAHFYPGPVTAERRYLECVAKLVDALATGIPAAGPDRTSAQAKHPGACSETELTKFAHGVDSTQGSAARDYSAAYEAVGSPFTAVVGTRARLRARPVGVERDLLDRFVLAPGPSHPVPEGAMSASKDYGLMGFGRIGYFWWGEGPEIYARLTAFAAELVLFYAYAGTPERAAPYWPILDRIAATREARPKQTFHEVLTTLGPEWAAEDRREIEREDTMLTYVMSIAASAALLAGDEARTVRYASHGEVHSVAVLRQVDRMLHGAPWETPKEDGHWADRAELFAAASTGDGQTVADVLVKQGATGREVLPRIVPRLHTNRAALDAWFAQRFPSPCLECGASDYFGHLSDRRAIAKLLGTAAEEARLAPIVARFVDAQTDPQIAWELHELETFFDRKR